VWAEQGGNLGGEENVKGKRKRKVFEKKMQRGTNKPKANGPQNQKGGINWLTVLLSPKGP